MSISSLLQTLTTTKNWDIDDTPQYWQNICDDPSVFATWKEVEYCLNNPQVFDIQLIDSRTNQYYDLQYFPRHWSKPCPDVSDIMDAVSNGHNIVINNFSWVNHKKQILLDQIENTFHGITADFHVYAGIKTSKSFRIHEDYSNNFIVQVEGETHWKVYNNRRSFLNTQINIKLKIILHYQIILMKKNLLIILVNINLI